MLVLVPPPGDLAALRRCLRALALHAGGAEIRVGRPDWEPWRAERLEALAHEVGAQLVESPSAGEGHGLVACLSEHAVVTPAWREGLAACLDARPSAGAAVPLTSGRGEGAVAFPPGFTADDLAEAVRDCAAPAYPRRETPGAVAVVVRGTLVAELLGGGEVAPGMVAGAAREAGAEVVTDDATFVLHAVGVAAGRERHVEPEAWRADLEGRIAVRGPRRPQEPGLLERLLRVGAGAPPDGRRTVGMRLAGRLERRRRTRRVPQSGPTNALRDEAAWRRAARRAARRRRRVPDNPSVLYLLPGLGAYGGVISVVQLVNRLLQRGVHAQVATAGRVDGDFLAEPLLFNPYRFASPDQLRRELPRHDLVVATRWDTVHDALLLAERWRSGLVGFVQDYEPDVHPEHHDAALAALRLLEHKVCKSRWLEERLQPLGGQVHRIPLGLDLDVFHPGAAPDGGARRIVSPARPDVAHRNLDGTLAILREIRGQRPDVLPTFFGKPFTVDDLEYEHAGRLRQAAVADLLRRSAVLLDASRFQGFGRPGLEAMACGTPAVLTTEGGINEYARNGENCLQAHPDDVAGFAEAVGRLLDDPGLADRLRRGGLETARAYDAELEADRTLALFRELAR